VRCERLLRRRREHAPIAHVETSRMQRTNEARAAKPPPVHARERMSADIIECKDAIARMTNEDFAPANLTGAHTTFRQIAKLHGRFES